jgi:RNA polymerase sigma factor (sigma-70 family)
VTVDNQDIQKYINIIKNAKPLPKKRQHELCVLIKTSNDVKEIENAKTQLIESNLKLVIKCVNRFKNSFNETNVDIDDLIANGNIGLMKAVEDYNPFNEHGANFTSFAFPIINHHIIKAIKSFRLIKIPSTYYVYSSKIKELSKMQLNDLSDEEICNNLQIQKDTLERYKNLINVKCNSIDKPDESEKEINLEELTITDNSGFDKLSAEEFRKNIKRHLDKLLKKQKEVLTKLYLEDENATLEQVARTFGESKQNIAATRDRAFERIKKSLMLDKSMVDYLDLKK